MAADDHQPSMATNQDPQNPLQCPRCSSSNTKFCYYNNYSLSQPRHFCKACKRYWTRGGTLRNVPVGGGCRRNKRGHKLRPSHGGASASANPNRIDLSPNPNNFQDPMLYGLESNDREIDFPFSSFRVSSDSNGFDLHRRIALGFPSGLNNSHSSNDSIYFGSSSFSTNSTMASLIASTLQQQKETRVHDEIPNSMHPQVKVGAENRVSWNPNPIDEINSSDPSPLLWNTSGISAWFDPSTMGSSVPSLI